MNNNDKYKKTFSNMYPSDESVEKIMDMTKHKKKIFSTAVKKITAVAAAFVLLVTGSFAVNQAFNNDDLSVMVVYASDGELITAGSANEQKLFYAIYVAPADDKEKKKEVLERYYADYNKVGEEMDELGENGIGTMASRGPVDCYNYKLDKQTVSVHIIKTGNIALSLDDYSNVKSFKVENKSPYGWLFFQDLKMFERFEEQAKTDEEYDFTYEETLSWYNMGHEFSLTGDELRKSQDSGRFAMNLKKQVNKGYFLEWQMSDVLCETLADNPDFDLSQIKDTITFTVEFNDGTVNTASLNLSFDSEGYMNFE